MINFSIEFMIWALGIFLLPSFSQAKIEHFQESGIQNTVCSYSGVMKSLSDSSYSHQVRIEPSQVHDSKWLTFTDLALGKNENSTLEFDPVGDPNDGLFMDNVVIDDSIIAHRVFGASHIILREEGAADGTTLSVFEVPGWWESRKLENSKSLWNMKYLKPNFAGNLKIAIIELQFSGCASLNSSEGLWPAP